MVNYMDIMKVNSKMWVLESRLHPHCEGLVYDASIVVVLPSLLLQIVIEEMCNNFIFNANYTSKMENVAKS